MCRSASQHRPLASLVLILVLSLGCSSANAPLDVSPAAIVSGTAAVKAPWKPVFIDLEGNELRPAEDPATKAIALVFILRDCPIANSYIPEINRLHASFRDRGIFLVLVHADADTTLDQARAHATEYQISPPVVLDPRHEWVNAAEAKISPEAVVFSPSGRIVYHGRINDQFAGLGKRRTVVQSHDLKDALEAVLADQPVREPRTKSFGCLIPKLTNGD
jgi:AhpC/TSA family protein